MSNSNVFCAQCEAYVTDWDLHCKTQHDPDPDLEREPNDGFGPRGSVLDEAARLVHGDRQQAYGHPADNHACTAALWNAYLDRRAEALDGKGGVDAFDVTMLNILQKVSRLAHSRTRDGLVDIAGFAANADMVGE